MNKIASYKIIPGLNLIIEVFGGRITIFDAIELKKREINDKDYNPNFNFIVSINEIDTDGKQDYDYSKYIDTVKENTRMYGIRRSAILTNTPKQVVGGVLYELAARELPMNFKIVSTLEAALTWVNLSIDYKSIVLENIELLAKAQPHTRHS